MSCYHEIYLDCVEVKDLIVLDITIKKMAKIRETLREMKKLVNEHVSNDYFGYEPPEIFELMEAIRKVCKEFIGKVLDDNFIN